MNIDEAAFERLFGGHSASNQMIARAYIETYLAALPALPSAEPGRDRIAAVVDEHGYVIASSATYAFKALQKRLEADGSKGPFEHFYITGNWPRPKPAEPVEVEGSVEGVRDA